MPIPNRYIKNVSDMHKIWESEGYFLAQTKIWEAQCEARHELYNAPTSGQLVEIKKALVLTPEDIDSLTQASGHETNTLLRLIQSRCSSEAGNFLHKGNTSSDVLDTSLAIQILESLDILIKDFKNLENVLKNLALKHKDTLQVGRSHGQHAVPQTFGRQVLGWYAEVQRDIQRLETAKKVISVGKCSGEIGTNVFIEPEVEELGLKKLGLVPDAAPTQIISRDRYAEVLALLAVNAGTLDRIATNIRLLSITDIGEVRELFDSASQQGSSAMPHKRNPELSERVCGLARVVRAAAQEELSAQALWFERDISHSSTERFAFPDAFEGLSYAARLSTKIIEGLVVYPEKMLENLNSTYGAIYSPRLLNALLETGVMSRTDAYDLVKELAQRAIDTKTPLSKLVQADKKISKMLKKEVLKELFDVNFYLKNIDTSYKRAGIS